MEGEWGAYSKQPIWHFWTTPRLDTLCGQRWFPGGDYEMGPEDLSGQKVCQKCKDRYQKRVAKEATDAASTR